jgi:hypothetical protein
MQFAAPHNFPIALNIQATVESKGSGKQTDTKIGHSTTPDKKTQPALCSRWKGRPFHALFTINMELGLEIETAMYSTSTGNSLNAQTTGI